jgi:hypothetical protein
LNEKVRRGDYRMAEKLVICDIAHAVLASVRLSVSGKKGLGRRFSIRNEVGRFVEG